MDTPRRILVADDSLPTCVMLKHELTNLDFEVDTAHNGAEAVTMALANEYQFILMDVYMPVMTGLEATKQILERLSAAGKTAPPIIAITAGASKEQCEAAGMTGYLEKPILGQTLRRFIADFFKGTNLAPALPASEPEAPGLTPAVLSTLLKSRRSTNNQKKRAL